jgi:hypothetical protein
VSSDFPEEGFKVAHSPELHWQWTGGEPHEASCMLKFAENVEFGTPRMDALQDVAKEREESGYCDEPLTTPSANGDPYIVGEKAARET